LYGTAPRSSSRGSGCGPSYSRRERCCGSTRRTSRGSPSAGLGDHTDLAAAGTAVLGRVVGREDLDFLNGVEIGGADRGAVGAGADTDRAVERDQGILRTAAVDGEAAGIEAVAESRAAAAADARLQHRQEQRVAAVQREVLNLRLFDGLADFELGFEPKFFLLE
jgi:hypothetical protein